MSYRSVRGADGLSEAYAAFARYDTPYESAVIDDFSGGVMTGVFPGDKNASEIINMEPVGRMLSSTCAPVAAFSSSTVSGPVHFSCCSDGLWLFRKGNTLYAFQNGELSVVGAAGQFTSDKTAIYHAGDRFYILDGDAIYMVDRELNLTQPEQYIPTCYTDVSDDGTVKTEAEKPNLFCRYIEIVLAVESVPMPSRTLPSDIAYDPTYIRIWDASGTELGDSQFNFENGEIYFFGFYSQKFVVRLKLIESEDMSKLSYTSLCKKREILVCPKRILSLPEGRGFLYYGGESGAQIIMLKPNPEYGFEYLSENNIIRKDYGQTISSVIEYSDGYLVFSAETIKKMAVSEDESGTPVFEFESFKSDFGSDMPGSVCGFDDKIIFANSQGGVFYINKFGIEERDVSRHISSVIEQGEKGFFSHTSAEYDAAAAVCAFGKYMLTVGNITYIWDYTARLPSATQSREDENKMVWTLNDVVTPSTYLLQIMRKLYFIDQTTGDIRCLPGGVSGLDTIASRVTTAESDLGTNGKKTILSLDVRYRAAGAVTLKLFFDGTLSCFEYYLPATDGLQTLTLRVHAHRFITCAAALSSECSFSLESLCFRYLPTKM